MALFDIFKRTSGAGSMSDAAHDEMVDAVNKRSFLIVDVREPGEFAAGHIPGAINRPLSQFDPAKLPNDKPVILVCQSGRRSARALAQVHAVGRRDVRHYPHGTHGWIGRGGRVDR